MRDILRALGVSKVVPNRVDKHSFCLRVLANDGTGLPDGGLRCFIRRWAPP